MDSAQARDRMVEAQIARRGVSDTAVLQAMRTVPREAFMSAGFEQLAYEDSALPIAEGQTISQPFIVGAMLAAAELDSSDKVLAEKRSWRSAPARAMPRPSSAASPPRCSPSNGMPR